MIKYLKTTDGYYFPAENVIGTIATATNDIVVEVKALAGTPTNDSLTVDGGAAGVPDKIAEALIDEINFGKQVVIALLDVHGEVTAATWAD